MKSLDARGVSIKIISPQFFKLINLEKVDLRDNPDLTEFPDFL